MKIIGLNGSPRKNGNSAALLDKALEGAASAGAEIERVDLYPLNFKGCRSCFACKRKGAFYGKGCAMKDDLTEVMRRMLDADGWVLSSPIYNGHTSSCLSALMERLFFSYHSYDEHGPMFSLEKAYPSLFLYNLNGGPEFVEKMGLEYSCKYDTFLFNSGFGPSRYMIAYNTLQFDDYSKYHSAAVPLERKMAWHEAHYAKDLERAYEMGRALVTAEGVKDD